MADQELINTDGIYDAAAAGAAGAQNALWKLMAARRVAAAIAEAQRRYDQGEADKREQRDFERQRIAQADARQKALDDRMARTATDTENKAALAQVTQFPGSEVSGTQLESMGVGKNSPVRASQFESLPAMLATRVFTGMSGTAGTPAQSQGAMSIVDQPGRPADMFKVRRSFSQEQKDQAADLAATKADDARILGETKQTAQEAHWQAQIDAANQRAEAAAGRRMQLTPSQTLNEITTLNKSYNTNTKGERQIVTNYGQMQNALKSLDDPTVNTTAATKAVVDSFERTLNPLGVVRQTAFQQDVGHQNTMDTLWGKWQAAFGPGGHGMTPQNLKAFATQIEPIARAAQQKVERERKRITNIATPYGLPVDQIFADEDNPFAAPTAPTAAGAPGMPAPAGYDAYVKRHQK